MEENNFSKSYREDVEEASASQSGEDYISQASQDSQDSRMEEDPKCDEESGFTVIEGCADVIGELPIKSPSPNNKGMLYSLSRILGITVRHN